MNNSNMLLTRDILSRLISMNDDNIIIDVFTVKKEIENMNILNYLIKEHNIYFKDSILIQKPEKLSLLNKIFKDLIDNNYNYLGFPIYTNVDWYVKRNGINLLIGNIYDIYTFRLLKSQF